LDLGLQRSQLALVRPLEMPPMRNHHVGVQSVPGLTSSSAVVLILVTP
jgi:hypothetical protein